MNLKSLSNQELHLATKAEVEHERCRTIKVLWHLRENERRMLYAKMGYRDLKEYCIKEFKYSEGSAWRRISAMRLLKEVPEVESKIQSGDLNLTQVIMAQSHFREVKTSLSEKKEILQEIENQTGKQTERVLAERKPEGWIDRPKETEKAKRGGNVEITLLLDEELQKDLEEIQVLLGKTHSKLELLKLMTKQTLETLRKKAQPKSQIKRPVVSSLDLSGKVLPQKECQDQLQKERKAQPLRSKGAAKSRYVAVGVRREIKIRDQDRCQYKDPQTGRRCEAKFHLQIEHKWPFAKGGEASAENLQLLCANHNRLRAVQQFGVRKMHEYLPSLR